MNNRAGVWVNIILEQQMSLIGHSKDLSDMEDLSDMSDIGDIGEGTIGGRVNSLGEHNHISLIGHCHLDVSYIGKVKIVNQRVSMEDMFKGIVGHIG